MLKFGPMLEHEKPVNLSFDIPEAAIEDVVAEWNGITEPSRYAAEGSQELERTDPYLNGILVDSLRTKLDGEDPLSDESLDNAEVFLRSAIFISKQLDKINPPLPMGSPSENKMEEFAETSEIENLILFRVPQM